MRYESGCLLNSLALIKGPSCFGLAGLGDQLACDTALGLKPFSVGPVKEDRVGGLYRKGGSTPIADNVRVTSNRSNSSTSMPGIDGKVTRIGGEECR